MRTKFNVVALVVSIAMLGATITGASAETRWDHNHPWRDQVNDRLGTQNHRIHREVREGEMTRQQARRLHREDRTIRHEERTMARFHRGHLTRADQRALNQQENAVSRQIGR